MNFRGNNFSLGAGEYISGVSEDGVCQLFVRTGGVISRKTFIPSQKTLANAEPAASYGEKCWRVSGRLLELSAGKLTIT